jgi:hypothetical protein
LSSDKGFEDGFDTWVERVVGDGALAVDGVDTWVERVVGDGAIVVDGFATWEGVEEGVDTWFVGLFTCEDVEGWLEETEVQLPLIRQK